MMKVSFNLNDYVLRTRGVELTELNKDERLEARKELEQLEQEAQHEINLVINQWKRKEQGCSI
jgi:hypothetical protein